MHGCEKGFFLWHILFYFDSRVVIVEIIVLVAVSADQVDAFFERDEDSREVTGEIISIATASPPDKLSGVLRGCLLFFERVLLLLLLLMLVVKRCYVKTHMSDVPTSEFKPHCFIAQVTVKVVLFGVTFE